MNVPAAAIDLIRSFEGCRLTAYRCPGDVWTIGWGRARGVKRGQTITQSQADAMLAEDVADVAARLRPLIAVGLTDQQFGALVSFAYNCGLGAFERSTLRDLVNAGRFDDVPAELAKWKRAGGKVLPGLAHRRAAEGALWSS